MKEIFFVIFIFLPNIVISQSFNCSAQTSCQGCLSHSYLCVWCKQPVVKGKRCGLEGELECTELVKGHHETKIIANLDFNSLRDEIVQVKPQKYHVSMGKGEKRKLNIAVKMADNYPVDMYFVMDSSKTMASVRQKLAEVVQTLVNKIGSLTKDYRLGVGSFVDKPIDPFALTHPDTTGSQCKSCAKTYGFRNHLNLTDDVPVFKKLLEGIENSSNVDYPEGSLEALMQAVVCQEIIGWRRNSRKIVVLFTNGAYHIAGDGKLAGILKANDLKCHLDSKGFYTHSTIMDYPSVAQLSSAINHHKTSLILAVSADTLKVYKRLCDHIQDCYIGDYDSHLEDLIFSIYETISETVTLKTSQVNNKHISVGISSKCLGYVERSTDRCENIKIGNQVEFEVELEALTCDGGKLMMRAIGEEVEVQVDVVCSCDCQKSAKRSEKCSNHGSMVCGVCECDAGYHGDDCTCVGSSVDQFSMCRNKETGEICSGKGDCVCGKCRCRTEKQPNGEAVQFGGEHCACRNDSCRSLDGVVCSGRGVCDCGKCRCMEGWTGEDCGCSMDTRNCTASNGMICNGKGTCVCGTCECDIDESYKGETCQECPTCPNMCRKLTNCVSCRLNHQNNHHSCIEECSKLVGDVSVAYDEDVVLHVVEKLPESVVDLCVQSDQHNCLVSFIYHKPQRTIIALKNKECSIQVNLMLIIGTTVGGVLLMGVMILLIWKISVEVYDRKEYKKFEMETNNANWSKIDNPLYRKVVYDFHNPTFESKKK